MMMFLVNGLSRCQIRPGTGSLSRYTYTTVFTVKNWPLNENTVNCSEMCNEGFAWNLDDFSRRYCKAYIRKFSRGVHTKIYGVFKVKNWKKKCNLQVQNVTGPESKHLQLPVRRSLYTTNLDANWNTWTGLCLAFYRQQPYKSFTVNLQICLL